MYINNLSNMKKHIGGYYEEYKKEVEEAKKKKKLDAPTQCMCDLELSFTKEVLELIEKYKNIIEKL